MSEDTTPDTTLRIARLIDAPPETVFDAWTKPEAMEVWYADGPNGHARVVEQDLRVGGRFRIEWGPDQESKYAEHGEYLVLERPNRLVLTETLEAAEGGWRETRVTVTFENVDGKTRLTLLHEKMPSKEARDGAAGGWPGFLDRLERYAITNR
jgi:uncharacterized protein YndB with AHSA1/START domain